jgi:hypothetical protein
MSAKDLFEFTVTLDQSPKPFGEASALRIEVLLQANRQLEASLTLITLQGPSETRADVRPRSSDDQRQYVLGIGGVRRPQLSARRGQTDLAGPRQRRSRAPRKHQDL